MADELPMPLTVRTIALPGRGAGCMAFLDFGPSDRPADAVFLHANGFNALTYRHVLAPLAAQFRILAIDQRGHGGATLETVIEGRRHWLDLRDDLLAFLDAQDLKHVVLSGHSMGATASLLAAVMQPARCRSLVLFDPVMPPPRPWGLSSEPGIVQAAGRRRAIFPSRDDALKSYRGRGAFSNWPEPMLADYERTGHPGLRTGLGSLRLRRPGARFLGRLEALHLPDRYTPRRNGLDVPSERKPRRPWRSRPDDHRTRHNPLPADGAARPCSVGARLGHQGARPGRP
jgi:pimeloyl-ACP methyl ester carboxylesterase